MRQEGRLVVAASFRTTIGDAESADRRGLVVEVVFERGDFEARLAERDEFFARQGPRHVAARFRGVAASSNDQQLTAGGQKCGQVPAGLGANSAGNTCRV